MTEWFKQNLALYSTPESRKTGKFSVLAIVEVIVAVATYWWIAAVWQTQVHIFVSLIAAPMYLLRSDESVAKAQGMWNLYHNERNINSPKFWLLLVPSIVIGGAIYWLYTHWLSNYRGWELLTLSIMSIHAIWYFSIAATVAVAVAFKGVGAVTVAAGGEVGIAGLGTGLGLGVIVGSIMTIGMGVGVLLRSLWTRIVSVASNLKSGLQSAPENWRRTLLTEDMVMSPEFVPGITDTSELTLNALLKGLKLYKKKSGNITILFLLLFLLLPSLLWRLSLKSTVWFYIPIFLMSQQGALADPEARKIQLTSEPPLLTTWGFYVSVFGLMLAVVAAINLVTAYDIWQGLDGEAPFSPIAWLFVVDWGYFINQPWKWFSFPATILTVVMYLWADHIRKRRDGIKKNDLNPDELCNIDGTIGTTIYRMDRARNALVIMSFLIGLWFFAKMAYFDNQLTPLDPWLASIFGPLQS